MVEILAILAPLIAALAPVLAQWILRRWAAQATPEHRIEKQKNENREAIAKGAAGELLLRRLDRVRDNENSRPRD